MTADDPSLAGEARTPEAAGSAVLASAAAGSADAGSADAGSAGMDSVGADSAGAEASQAFGALGGSGSGGGNEAAGTAQTGSTAVDRRSFVRALAGDSVTTAGKLAGISGLVMGSVVAAAKAANDSFAALGGLTAPRTARPLAPLPVPSAPAPVPSSSPAFTDSDRVTLGSLTVGLLATNQPGAAPAVGVVRFRFDGEAFRIPGRSATARTTNLQRDPHAALTLIDPETGDALLIAGRARIVYGADAMAAAEDVLDACGVPHPEGWAASDSRGEPILIVLQPQRLFRRRANDERP